MKKQGRPRVLTDEQRKENNSRARDDWNKRNTKKSYRYQKKSRARSFIMKDATHDELLELRALIDERLKAMEQ